MCWGGRWHWLSYGKLSGTRLKSLSRRFTTCINIPSSLHTWGKAWTPTRLLQCKKKKEPSSTSWVSVPRHKGDVQHNWHCDQVLKVNAESVRDWTEPLKQAIIFLRVGAVRTQDPQLGQLMVDLLKQLRFPHPVLIQSCLGLDHVFTQSWSCPPPRHGHDYNTALLTAQSTPWDQISFLCLYHLETHQAQGAGWWAEGEVERIHFTTGGIRESPVI